ncbi:hypothetical protein [Bacterioplanoides pacificum]|uniref:Uncharacterized protein n=1 Tax=Bacterioplanoides pacificum TaxID=1171596 RepID=A0ABV7VVQ3_9GAMM
MSFLGGRSIVLLLLLTIILPVSAQQNSIFSGLTLQASSAPVPVSDMINGWDGPFQPGDYAYADGRISFGFGYHGWTLKREQRWYYYLEFSEQTSRTFSALERGDDIDSGVIDLKVWAFESYGLSILRKFSLTDDLAIEPEISFYRIGHHQYGKLTAVVDSGLSQGEIEGAVGLDYTFDEYKIGWPDHLKFLEANEFNTLSFDDRDKGEGLSFNLSILYQYSKNWNLNITLLDAWNRQRFSSTVNQKVCSQSGQPSNPLCGSNGLSGGNQVYSFSSTIPVTLDSVLSYQPWDAKVSYFQHGRYRRLGISKFWKFGGHRLSVSGYSDRQLGVGWQGRWHLLQLSADESEAARIRDLELTLTFQFHW